MQKGTSVVIDLTDDPPAKGFLMVRWVDIQEMIHVHSHSILEQLLGSGFLDQQHDPEFQIMRVKVVSVSSWEPWGEPLRFTRRYSS